MIFPIIKLATTFIGIAIACGYYYYHSRREQQNRNTERPHAGYDITTPYDSKKSTSCSICLSDFDRNSRNIITLPCQHRFHFKCIEPIVNKEQQRRCPNCRAQILSNFNIKE